MKITAKPIENGIIDKIWLINFKEDKNKKLLNSFIKQLKKDKKVMIYDKQNDEWNIKYAYYGHLFADYYFNKFNNNTEKIDYDKHIIFDEFINPSNVDKNIKKTKNWYVNFIKESITENLHDIIQIDIAFYDVIKQIDKNKVITYNENKKQNDGQMNWFYYHNLNYGYKFNELVKDFEYFDFDLDIELKNIEYISEIILEPIQKNDKSLKSHIGYRVYCEILKSNDKEKIYIIEEIFNVDKKKWTEFQTKDKIGLIKLTQNFMDDPVTVDKKYLNYWLKEKELNLNKNKPKENNNERER